MDASARQGQAGPGSYRSQTACHSPEEMIPCIDSIPAACDSYYCGGGGELQLLGRRESYASSTGTAAPDPWRNDDLLSELTQEEDSGQVLLAMQPRGAAGGSPKEVRVVSQPVALTDADVRDFLGMKKQEMEAEVQRWRTTCAHLEQRVSDLQRQHADDGRRIDLLTEDKARLSTARQVDERTLEGVMAQLMEFEGDIHHLQTEQRTRGVRNGRASASPDTSPPLRQAEPLPAAQQRESARVAQLMEEHRLAVARHDEDTARLQRQLSLVTRQMREAQTRADTLSRDNAAMAHSLGGGGGGGGGRSSPNVARHLELEVSLEDTREDRVADLHLELAARSEEVRALEQAVAGLREEVVKQEVRYAALEGELHARTSQVGTSEAEAGFLRSQQRIAERSGLHMLCAAEMDERVMLEAMFTDTLGFISAAMDAFLLSHETTVAHYVARLTHPYRPPQTEGEFRMLIDALVEEQCTDLILAKQQSDASAFMSEELRERETLAKSFFECWLDLLSLERVMRTDARAVEVSHARSEVVQLSEELTHLKLEYVQRDMQCERLEKALAKRKEEASKVKREAHTSAEAQQAAAALAKKEVAHRAKANERCKDLEAQLAEAQRVAEDKAHMEKVLGQLQKTIEEQRRQLEQRAQRERDRTEPLERLEADLQDMRERHGEACERIEANAKQYQEELGNHEQALRDLTLEVQEKDAVIEDLRHDVTVMTRQLQDGTKVHFTLSLKDSELQQCKIEKDEAERRLAEATQELRCLNAELATRSAPPLPPIRSSAWVLQELTTLHEQLTDSQKPLGCDEILAHVNFLADLVSYVKTQTLAASGLALPTRAPARIQRPTSSRPLSRPRSNVVLDHCVDESPEFI